MKSLFFRTELGSWILFFVSFFLIGVTETAPKREQINTSAASFLRDVTAAATRLVVCLTVSFFLPLSLSFVLSLSLSLSTVHQLFPALQFTTYLMTVTDTVAVAGEPPAEPSPNPMAFNPTNPMNEPGRQGSARVSNVNTNRDNPPPPPFFIVDSRGLRPTRFFSIGADKGDRSMVPLALARTRVAQIWKSWPT